MTKRRKLKAILLLAVVLEAFLLIIAFAPVTVYSRELNSAYHQYMTDPSERTKEAYEEARRRILGPLHLVQDFAVVLALMNPFIIFVFARRLRHDSGLESGRPKKKYQR